ncbi:hypothetical protein F4553_005463 [Allocatelliglobosispora scoriae]|uniref:Uncharacterized protein n=1 Tax=Allocatelliglobosispora scoriae TaxID=643052 RepID=A0A841BY27_9ACTN|nr:hypothetical protein [Allocatelliglobosispora scoriae]MBB5872029.1 hypothetical protein [Allocatelliglobosispora scoriae]
MLSEEEAGVLAENYLQKYCPEASEVEVRTDPEHAFVDGINYIVPFNSVERLDGGNLDAELTGNYPIRVNLQTGECDTLTLNELAAYARRRRSH